MYRLRQGGYVTSRGYEIAALVMLILAVPLALVSGVHEVLASLTAGAIAAAILSEGRREDR